MKIVITGGAGFLGRRLAASLLERGALVSADLAVASIDEIVLFDAHRARGFDDRRIRVEIGDLCDPERVGQVIDARTDGVFHLGAVVSGDAEENFDKGMRVNVDGTRAVLEACRALPRPPCVVFGSSVAVFGGELPEVVQDGTAPTPQSSYGAEKLIGEVLVSDYTRRGFIDGRSVRLPTVCVRAGRPNKAASGFASAIIREPLNGEHAVCPVSAETVMWLCSPRAAVDNLVHAFNLPTTAWWSDRTVNLPGLSVSVGEMVAALGRVTDRETVERVLWQPNPSIATLVNTWPGYFNTLRATGMGFRADPDFDWVIRAYMEDELTGAAAAS